MTDGSRSEELFDAAARLAPAERASFLAAACGDDTALLQDVASLLAADEDAEDRLSAVVQSSREWCSEAEASATPAEPAMIGRLIGHWRVTGLVDTGGMGAIYKAVRADREYEQEVAIKVLRRDLGGPENERRLVQERQALADLDHPNVARLLDGGTTEEGRPFLVMELIDGQPIDRWCDARRLSLVQRIELFRMICAAVHHAHRNLIVHRDVKCSNVLVTAEGVPKLLDFGIAKLLESGDTPTRSTQLMLTPEYASPEQFRNEGISTATDVYSLGVVLFELLVGRRPFTGGDGAVAALALQVLRDAPTPPSDAAIDPASERALLFQRARDRGCAHPERLRRALLGDLDHIVLMALRKEPERRYASAEQLAMDLERHVRGRTVLARPDTVRYRAGKFLRRNRFVVGAGVLVLAALSTNLYMASDALGRERAQAAERERLLFASLGLFQANPYLFEGTAEFDQQVRVLEEWTQRVSELDFGNTQLELRFLRELTQAWSKIGMGGRSAGLRERILELIEADPERDELAYATALVGVGRHDEARALRRRLLVPPHPDLAQSLRTLASPLERAGEFEAALEIATSARRMLFEVEGTPPAMRISFLESESHLLHKLNRAEEALELKHRAVRIARAALDSNPLLLPDALKERGWLLQDMGRYAEAEADCLEARRALETRLPAGHPEILGFRWVYALLLKDTGRFELAETELEEIALAFSAVLGAAHISVAKARFGQAMVSADRGAWERAVERATAVVAAFEVLSANNPFECSAPMTLLGRALCHAGSAAEARSVLSEAYRIRLEYGAPGAWETNKTASILGDCLSRLGQYAAAEALLLDSYGPIRASRGPDHYRTTQAAQRIVAHFGRTGDHAAQAEWEARISPRALESPLVHPYR